MDLEIVRLVGVYAGTFVVCAVGGLLPLVNCEVYLLVVAATASPAQVPGIVVAAAFGQMTGKVLLYLTGRGALRLPLRSDGDHRWSERLRLGGRKADGVVLTSAFSGIPPFYAVSVGAGVMRWDLGRFVVMGTCGRLLRFGLLMALPLIVKEVWR